MEDQVSLKFWGTRGLISSPGKEFTRYGGNTQSIQILYRDHLIIIDTGFGITNLGEQLIGEILGKKRQVTAHIFFTHFHWDHIQGLPFFHPIYFPNTTLNLYSPCSKEATHRNLDLLFDGSYSPFAGIGSMPSTINYHQLQQGFELDGLRFEFLQTDHGLQAIRNTDDYSFAYKLTCTGSGHSTCIATDHEARPGKLNSAFIEFARGSHLLVHDAQFNEQEYEKHTGWGHSSSSMALDNALAIGCDRCLLTHHAPGRTDEEINFHIEELKSEEKYHNLAFDFAREEEIYKFRLLRKSA